MNGLIFPPCFFDDTIKRCEPVFFRNFKDKLDQQLEDLDLENFDITYEIMKISLQEDKRKDLSEKIKEIVERRSRHLSEKPKVGVFVNFGGFVMKMLHLSEFDHDQLCLEALSEFRDILASEHFDELTEENKNRCELSSKQRQALLKSASEKMKAYIQKKLSMHAEAIQSMDKVIEILDEKKNQILASKKQKVKTINVIDPIESPNCGGDICHSEALVKPQKEERKENIQIDSN